MKTRLRSTTVQCGNASLVHKKPSGYTIVEVMVFLAITASIFVMFISTFSGRQARTEFSTGVRDMESRVRDIVNDTNTGYAASLGDLTCRVDTSRGSRLDFGNDPRGGRLGTNGECIFVGRVLQFGVTGNNRVYQTHSIAASRLTREPTLSGEEALAGNYTGSRTAVIPGTSNEEALPPGLEFAWMRARAGPADQPLTDMPFISSFATLSKLEDADQAGSLDSYILPMPLNSPMPGTATQNTDQVVNEVRRIGCGTSAGDCYTAQLLALGAGLLQDIRVCFNSQGSDQHAIISMKGFFSGNGSTDAEILEGDCPA